MTTASQTTNSHYRRYNDGHEFTEISDRMGALRADAYEHQVLEELQAAGIDLDELTTPDAPPPEIRGSSAAMQAFVSTAPLTQQINRATAGFTAQQRTSDEFHRQIEAVNAVQIAITAANPKQTETGRVNLAELQIPGSPYANAAELIRSVGLGDQVFVVDTEDTTLKQLAAVTTGIQERQTKLTEGNQMKMIALQDLMHQRDLFIQLATNSLSARQQSEKHIADNIR